MPRILSAFPLLLAFFLCASSAFSEPLPNAPLISRITVRGTDIFDFETATYLKKFPYTWINRLHIQTKEQVIRRQLLFKVGDALDEFLLRETERNLRALPFINSARVAVFPQRDGTVAVVVHTRDSWTTEPQINMSGLNSVDTIEFGFKEKNFLGYGKTVQVFYKTQPDRIERSVGYFDPNLFGSRWQLDVDAFTASDGRQQKYVIERPFFSSITPYAAKTSYLRDVLILPEYENNEKVSEYEKTTSDVEVGGGAKIGTSKRIVSHAGLRYRQRSLNYAPTQKTDSLHTLPDEQKFKTVFFDFDIQKNNFIEMTELDKMLRIEDINLGAFWSASPGLSPRAITHQKSTWDFSSKFNKDTLLYEDDILRFNAEYESRNTFINPENERVMGHLKYYLKQFRRHTLVVHGRVEWGHDLESGNEIFLGNENGLRGFKRDALVGDRSLLINIEDRIFLINEFANLVSLGAVTFYDAGLVWDQGSAVSLSDMKSDIGVGLRFGLTKSANEVVIRLDFACRLQKISSNDPRMVVSFGTSQAF